MEDYAGAYWDRTKDVKVLLGEKGPREVAAFHLGGIAVECRVKALLACYHGITEWAQPSKRAKDPRRKQPINNPGHDLFGAIRHMASLHKRAKTDPLFLKHLGRILHPTGATATGFIAIRYSSREVPPAELAEWKQSFSYVCGWLRKNEEVLS